MGKMSLTVPGDTNRGCAAKAFLWYLSKHFVGTKKLCYEVGRCLNQNTPWRTKLLQNAIKRGLHIGC
jgi:hypothetical protein